MEKPAFEKYQVNKNPLNTTQPLDSIRYMVYNGYYKVMSNIPKMGHLPTPEHIVRFLPAPPGANDAMTNLPIFGHK